LLVDQLLRRWKTAQREKVGRRSDALALYQKRKADARRKIRLPELIPGKAVTFGLHRTDSEVQQA
jgi:hypothetical protein